MRLGLLLCAAAALPSSSRATLQGPKPNAPPAVLGGWRCCWGISSCAAANNRTCPAEPEPPLTGCATDYAACVGPCSRPGSQTLWCETAPRCEPSTAGQGQGPRQKDECTPPPSSFDDPTLRQAFRPPQLTPMQRAAMEKIGATALRQSAEAEPWVLQYLEDIRPSLDPSLQHLPSTKLLEMYRWEFQRLPVFHNAPLDAWDVDRIGINDDSPLNITLDNGHIQQPCERWVYGGPEDLFTTIMYGDMFWAHFDLQLGHLCDLTSSLRGANDCLLFNANNLLHGSIGNYECKTFRCLLCLQTSR